MRDLTNEAELILALKAREEAAFMALMEQLQDRLMRTATNYVGDRAVAEDVVQNTWVAVLGSIDRFERRASLSTWIHSILINHARNANRREQRHAPVPETEQRQEEIACPRRTPDRQLLQRELGVAIKAAVAALPARQREVVELRDVEGLSSEEVCMRVGLSESNQRVLLHRARASMRRSLSHYLR